MIAAAGPTVAYLSHWFPALSERYVPQQIDAIRARGIGVLVIAVKQPLSSGFLREAAQYAAECTYITPLRPRTLLLAILDCLRDAGKLRDIYARVLWGGRENIPRRMKALMHTFLGAYLARVLRGRATHIHANHGYFPAWAAMVASRLTGIPYSLTLHGSDLLVDQIYIDLKARNACFVVTISDFNKRFLLDRVPGLPSERVVVNRLGIDPNGSRELVGRRQEGSRPFVILTVGRLHAVKNQEFLLEACRLLADDGLEFVCRIVGAGPTEKSLAAKIERLQLGNRVTLAGNMPSADVAREYERADLFVLTSRSEGLPIVLIEAMSHGVPVLAPAITGIPELVTDGLTGALYTPNDLDDLVARIRAAATLSEMERDLLRRRARERVLADYDGTINTAEFAKLFETPCSAAPVRVGRGD
ncbi:MAG: glycosyltransferase [Anaerolineae bacterium]|nr:glycosyltransferase [Gemmatimonadaceae bacterium]